MNKQLIKTLKRLNTEYQLIKMKINYKDHKLLERYHFLHTIHHKFIQWVNNEEEIEITKSLLLEENSSSYLQDELVKRENKKKIIERELTLSLIRTDPNDIHNCLIEIHAGTGGNEASLFVETLFKMYQRYAYLQKWVIKIINIHSNNYKGYKYIIFRICGKDAYGKLKFESGGHRVQRIPETESQGRIHTSTCTVAVLPDLPENESIKIDANDLKIDTFRSSGAGGQHVNTTDSAIRITHIPTGIVVECQNERSQHKNKSQALSILKARINQLELLKKHNELSIKKRLLLGSGDRSSRHRTYNYAQGRITDHRINFTIYELDSVLNGKLDLLIIPIRDFYNNELVKNEWLKL